MNQSFGNTVADDGIISATSNVAVVLSHNNADKKLDLKSLNIVGKLSEGVKMVMNEPSVSLYRVQEHIRRSVPGLVELKHDMCEMQHLVVGSGFDTDYSTNAANAMHDSIPCFRDIQDLMKNAMFMKQQLEYRASKKMNSC